MSSLNNKEINIVVNRLVELSSSLKKEISKLDFHSEIKNNFLSKLRRDTEKRLINIINSLDEIVKIIHENGSKEHIFNLFEDITLTKHTEQIQAMQEVNQYQGCESEKEFFSNITALMNFIAENMEDIFHDFNLNYDIYQQRNNKKYENKKFLLEKLYFPIVVGVIIALSTWYINNKLTTIEENQKKEQQEKRIEKKFNLKSDLNKVLFNIKDKYGNFDLQVNTLNGLLSLSDKKEYSKTQIDTFKILMENLKTTSNLIRDNQKNIDRLFNSLLKDSEIFDSYYNSKINIKIKKLLQQYTLIESELRKNVIPLFNVLMKKFITSIKEGTVLEDNPEVSIKLIKSNISNIEKSVLKAKNNIRELEKIIININKEFEE